MVSWDQALPSAHVKTARGYADVPEPGFEGSSALFGIWWTIPLEKRHGPGDNMTFYWRWVSANATVWEVSTTDPRLDVELAKKRAREFVGAVTLHSDRIRDATVEQWFQDPLYPGHENVQIKQLNGKVPMDRDFLFQEDWTAADGSEWHVTWDYDKEQPIPDARAVGYSIERHTGSFAVHLWQVDGRNYAQVNPVLHGGPSKSEAMEAVRTVFADLRLPDPTFDNVDVSTVCHM